MSNHARRPYGTFRPGRNQRADAADPLAGEGQYTPMGQVRQFGQFAAGLRSRRGGSIAARYLGRLAAVVVVGIALIVVWNVAG